MSTSVQTAAAANYDIDPAHSSAQFKVRHLMISHVKGEFTRLGGSIDFNPAHPGASKVDVTIDATSVSTREEQRDNHLKSADFFDVAKYPNITFKSTKVAADGKDAYKVTGDLTIHGVTKSIVLDVEGVTPEAKDPWGYVRRGATASATIDRRDFGLVWNSALETGGVLVGDEVKISIDVEMSRKA